MAKETMPFMINGRNSYVSRFPLGDRENKGYIALYYESRSASACHPTFFATREEAVMFLKAKKEEYESYLGSFYWNKEN